MLNDAEGSGGLNWVGVESDGANARGLRGLGALADLELDLLGLLQGAEAGALNFRVVDKNIRGAVLGGDKAEALLRVEPLHSSLWHLSYFPSLIHRVRSAVFRQIGPVPTAIPSWSARNSTRPTTLAGTATATSFLRVLLHQHRS